MKITKLSLAILVLASAVAGYTVYAVFLRKPEEKLFDTAPIQKRTISQIIKASGTLEFEDDLMKIGSIVQGVIRTMHVAENQRVKKGDLLVEIDDGKEDTEVRSTKAALNQAAADFAYQEKFFQRQEALFNDGFIAQDSFEKITSNFIQARENVKRKQADYDFATLTYQNKFIKAPEDGLVIGKLVSEGETVTLSAPATIIYTIATDVTKMKAKLEIDESVIGDLKIGTAVTLTFDTYPNRLFHGKVTDISNSPTKTNGAISYLATVPLDNTEQLFRPGMTVDAKIVVAEKSSVPVVPGYAFKINKEILQQIAQTKGYGFKELQIDPSHKNGKEVLKSIWIFENNIFVERAVKTGVSDNAYFEVLEGLSGNEHLVIDTVEPDIMKQFFERFFGKGL